MRNPRESKETQGNPKKPDESHGNPENQRKSKESQGNQRKSKGDCLSIRIKIISGLKIISAPWSNLKNLGGYAGT